MRMPSRCASIACCTLLLTAALGAAANSIGPQGTPTPHAAASMLNGPAWKDLSLAQREVLKPLEPEWNGMPGARKRKWLTMADRYAELSPEQQARMQERMGAWATLTPEQRRIARENYARARKLQPDQKSAEWQQYQQLSEEEKKRLAEQTKARKGVASLPPPAAQDKAKLVPPPKSVLKRELQPAPAASPHPTAPARAAVPLPAEAASQAPMPPAAQPQPSSPSAN